MQRPLTSVVAVIVASMALTACWRSQPRVAFPPATLDAPPPVAAAVEGECLVETVLAHPAGQVDRNAPPEPDAASVGALVEPVCAWLDGHLTDLSRGGPGQVRGITARGLPPPARHQLADGLANPRQAAVAATYAVTVGHGGAPGWAEVIADVQRIDGSIVRAVLVFVPGDDGPQLVAYEADLTPPPAWTNRDQLR